MAGSGSTIKAVAAETTNRAIDQTIEYCPNSSIGRTLAATTSGTKLDKLMRPWSSNANPSDAFHFWITLQAKITAALRNWLACFSTWISLALLIMKRPRWPPESAGFKTRPGMSD